jgi:hypothetical protein
MSMNVDSTTRVLRWCFSRGTQVITCAIDVRLGDLAYNVLTIPHWDPLAGTLERVGGAAAALQRHAAIALELRECGWRVASYTE